MNEEAIFEYKWFDYYFMDKDRNAFFIRKLESDKLWGFVMINSYLQKFAEGHSVAEFMVIPRYRRKSVGKRAAYACFDKFRGNWEVVFVPGNKQAFYFWKRVFDEYTNQQSIFEDGIFLFSNRG